MKYIPKAKRPSSIIFHFGSAQNLSSPGQLYKVIQTLLEHLIFPCSWPVTTVCQMEKKYSHGGGVD